MSEVERTASWDFLVCERGNVGQFFLNANVFLWRDWKGGVIILGFGEVD